MTFTGDYLLVVSYDGEIEFNNCSIGIRILTASQSVPGRYGTCVLSGNCHVHLVTYSTDNPNDSYTIISDNAVIDVVGETGTVITSKYVIVHNNVSLRYGTSEETATTIPITAGTYTAINADGTTEPPQE